MSLEIPDMSDPDIRAMVLDAHCPTDRWTVTGKLIGVVCCTCLNTWPCPSIRAARAVENKKIDTMRRNWDERKGRT